MAVLYSVNLGRTLMPTQCYQIYLTSPGGLYLHRFAVPSDLSRCAADSAGPTCGPATTPTVTAAATTVTSCQRSLQRCSGPAANSHSPAADRDSAAHHKRTRPNRLPQHASGISSVMSCDYVIRMSESKIHIQM